MGVNRRNKAYSCPFLVVCCLLGATAYAGETTSIALGDWGEAQIWDLGEPTDLDTATIEGIVKVTLPAEVSGEVHLGAVSYGELDITSGSLTISDYLSIGMTAPALISQSGGTLRILGPVSIGEGSVGEIAFTGGLLVARTIAISVGGAPGTMTIEGAGSTIRINRDFVIGITAAGTLRIKPTSDGPSGLTPIQVRGDIILSPELSKLAFEPQFPIEVGNSWTIATADGSVEGSFAMVATPPRVSLSITSEEGGALVVTVTGIAPPIPAAGHWALGGLLVTLSLLGLFFIGRAAPPKTVESPQRPH